MIFITEDDFKRKLSVDIRAQITESDPDILDDVEADAMAIIQDALSPTYDLDAEFAKAEDDRNKNLIRIMLNLMVYFIYERVPDTQVPERVVKNYDDTISEINKIEAGKKNISLAKIVDEETGEVSTVFRWGEQQKASPHAIN
jgi:hypothetical protein